MQYATLGNTGLVVSRLAFGAMTFTSGNRDFASIYKVGAQAANELVARSLDAGVKVTRSLPRRSHDRSRSCHCRA